MDAEAAADFIVRFIEATGVERARIGSRIGGEAIGGQMARKKTEKARSAPQVAVEEAQAAPQEAQPAADQTQISVSRGFGNWLSRNRCSLAFTSYQTGQLFLVGLLPNGQVSFHQQNYVRAMGVHATRRGSMSARSSRSGGSRTCWRRTSGRTRISTGSMCRATPRPPATSTSTSSASTGPGG